MDSKAVRVARGAKIPLLVRPETVLVFPSQKAVTAVGGVSSLTTSAGGRCGSGPAPPPPGSF